VITAYQAKLRKLLDLPPEKAGDIRKFLQKIREDPDLELICHLAEYEALAAKYHLEE